MATVNNLEQCETLWNCNEVWACRTTNRYIVGRPTQHPRVP